LPKKEDGINRLPRLLIELDALSRALIPLTREPGPEKNVPRLADK